MLKIPTKMVDLNNPRLILKKSITTSTSTMILLCWSSRTKYVLLTNIVGNSFCEDVTKIVLSHSIFEMVTLFSNEF